MDLTYIKAQIEAGADSDTLLSVVQQAMDDYTTREQQSDTLTQAQQSADAAQSTLEQAQKEFDSAVETYNKNEEETNTKITELTDSLDDLKSDYEQAERDATTQKAELQMNMTLQWWKENMREVPMNRPSRNWRVQWSPRRIHLIH